MMDWCRMGPYIVASPVNRQKQAQQKQKHNITSTQPLTLFMREFPLP